MSVDNRKGVHYHSAYPGSMFEHTAGEYSDAYVKAEDYATLTARCEALKGALIGIHNYAHDQSSGPVVPDGYWGIRDMAARALDTEQSAADDSCPGRCYYDDGRVEACQFSRTNHPPSCSFFRDGQLSPADGEKQA